MSWAAAGYVRRLARTPTGRALTRMEKFLLLVIADYYNDEEGSAWPTVEALARDVLASKRWVVTCLGRLVEGGALELVPAPAHVARGRGWARHAYRIGGFLGNEVVNSVHHLPDGEAVKAVNSVHHPDSDEAVNSGARGGELSRIPLPPIPPIPRVAQPTTEPTGENARARREAAAPLPPASPKRDKPDLAALAAWDEACGYARRHVQLRSEAKASVGAYRPEPPALPPRTQAAMRSVGAVRLREALLERPRELGFVRREFLAAFETLPP